MPALLMKVKVIDADISTGTYEEMVEQVFTLAHQRPSSFVCCANAHMVIEAHEDPDFRRLLNSADLVTPDGMPVAKAIAWQTGQPQARVAGMDLLPDLLREAAARGKSVYFYGNTQKVLDGITARIARELPTLRLVGAFSPPFRALSPAEEADIVDQINAAAPDLIFVALGCPKQEKWMAAHRGKLRGVMLGVGGAFNVYAGQQARSPEWMQKLALEWLFRLLLEPRRLWKRYLVTNSQFIWLFLRSYRKNKQLARSLAEAK